MGKIIVSSLISIDGFAAAPNGEFVPPEPTADLFRHFIEPNMQSGIFIYGRVTYEFMVGYWTSSAADPTEAAKLAAMRKFVYSKTLQNADWGRVTISRGDDLAADVAAMRRETDKDLTFLGSATLVNAFLRAGLVDALLLLVNPMTLGAGTPLFQGGHTRTRWKLTRARPFDSGTVLMTYER